MSSGKRVLKKREAPLWPRCVLYAAGAICMGLAAAVAVQWVVTGSIGKEVWPWFSENPGYLLLTALLYAAVTALLGFVTGHLAIAGGIVGFLALALSLVDYFKNAINGTPLELADFGLAAQLGQVAGVAGDLTPPVDFWRAALALVVCVALLALAGRFTRLRGRARLTGGAVSLILTVLLFTSAGAGVLGPAFGVDMYTRTAASVSHDRYGLTLSLWRDCFLQAMKGPEGYSEDYMNQVLARIDELTADYETEEPAVKPNVIVVLSESFYDLTRLPDLTYERDPLENFHALESESISGTFHSHYLGYGTGYIEMAMLEGASSTRIFFQIKLRYIFPTILFVTILSLINSMKIFREVYLLAGNYPYEGLYTLQHFMNNTFANLNYQKLSAAAVLLALVLVVLIALLFKAENIFGKDVEG